MFRYSGIGSPLFKIVGDVENRPAALTTAISCAQIARTVQNLFGRSFISAVKVSVHGIQFFICSFLGFSVTKITRAIISRATNQQVQGTSEVGYHFSKQELFYKYMSFPS